LTNQLALTNHGSDDMVHCVFIFCWWYSADKEIPVVMELLSRWLLWHYPAVRSSPVGTCDSKNM